MVSGVLIALSVGVLAACGSGSGSDAETGAFTVDGRSGAATRVGNGRPLAWVGRSLVLLDGQTVRTVAPDGEELAAARLPIRDQVDDINDVAAQRDQIAFIVTASTDTRLPRNALVTQRADGTQQRVLARRATGTPVFSDDGRRIVVSTSGAQRPVSVALDGQSSRRLSEPLTALAAVKGGRFIGTQARDTNGRRRLVVYDGTRSRTLLRSWVGGTVSPAPNGRQAVVNTVTRVDVTSLRTGKRRAVRQPADIYAAGRSAWAPDGTRFAGTSKQTVLTWNSSGTDAKTLATFDDRVASLPLWAPNGRSLAVAVTARPPVGKMPKTRSVLTRQATRTPGAWWRR